MMVTMYVVLKQNNKKKSFNILIMIFIFIKEEKVYSGTGETFGKQWQTGDVVGVFLDLIDHTISKF